MPPSYTVYPTAVALRDALGAEANSSAPLDSANPALRQIDSIEINDFHPASSSHRPRACAKMSYDERNLFVWFHIEDRYVLSTRMNYQDPVYRDSCVEFFIQPRAGSGYFNFEINCGGTLSVAYIEDPTRDGNVFAKSTPVAAELGRRVRIRHSAPAIVHPEISEPFDWQIDCRVPLSVLEAYVGPLGPLEGQTWHANFFKCAEDNSHPHWASWSPIGDALNFHQPQCFAPLRFAGQRAEVAAQRELLSNAR